MLIDGTRFRFWERISVNLAVDNIAMLELGGPFDPDNSVFTSAFKPFSFLSLNAMINDGPLFTGTISPVIPQIEPRKVQASIGAYSLPGILNECTAPGGDLPLEFKGLNLHEIGGALAGLFDINVDAKVAPGPVFKKVASNPGMKIIPFLTPLAKQRNQVMSSNEVGDLVFQQAIDGGSPVASLEQGQSPVVNVTPTFNPAEYYSEITGLKSVKVRSKRSQAFTLQNPLWDSNIIRPLIFVVPDALDGDLEAAVTSKMARMFANTIRYSLDVATWRDPQDDLWEPNTIVRLKAPGAMIYNAYDFLIKGVNLVKDAKSEKASLTLVLPGSFSTAEAAGLPWDV